MGSAAADSASFDRLRFEHLLQRVDRVPPRERKKGFVARGAIREIAFEHALDRAGRILCLDIAVNFAAKRGVRSEAATDVNVITLDLLVTFLDLASEQADVADVVLCARMMTTGEMNVHRPIEIDARFAPLRDI